MQRIQSSVSRRAFIIIGVSACLALLIWWRAVLSVLVIIISAALLASLMHPLAVRFERRMKPGGAAALALLILTAGLFVFIGLIAPALRTQTEQLLLQLPSIMESLKLWTTGANNWLADIGIPEIPDITGQLMNLNLSVILSGIVQYAGGVLGQMAQWLLAPMLAFYFLKDRERFCHGLTMLIPIAHRRRALLIASETRRALMIYIRGHALVSLFVGAASAIGLLILGVPTWLAMGVWIALTDLIPYFGPIIGALPILLFGPVLGLTKMLWALGVLFAVNQLEANLIVPNVISDQMGIHPVTVLLALLLGNLMFGLWGVVLSLPVLIVVKTIDRSLRAFSPVEGGRGM